MSRRPFLAIGIAALVIFAPAVYVAATTTPGYARQPAAGGNATGVIASVGMRAVAVRIADYDGAIVHADPVETNDLRFFELHWSDGQSDFTVYGNVSGATAIDVARSIYCA